MAEDSIRANEKPKAKYEPTPHDGYRAVITQADDCLGKVNMVQRFAGEARATKLISYEPAPVPGDDAGEIRATASMQRSQVLADAVCRFINCGGSIDDARKTCESVLANILTVNGGNETSPMIGEPWELLETYCVGYEHTFFDPRTGNAVVWLEDESIVKTNLQILQQEREVEAGLGQPEQALSKEE
jgi:hypothetical protein